MTSKGSESMLFRQAGIFHTDYASDRALFPIAADRYMIGMLLLLALAAPLYLNSLYLSSYLLPDRRRSRPQPDSRMGGTIPPWLCRRDGNRRLRSGPCHEIRNPLGNRHHPCRIDGGDHWERLRLRRAARQGFVPGALYPRLAVRHGLDDLPRTRDQRRYSGHFTGAGPSLRTPDYTTLHSSGASW